MVRAGAGIFGKLEPKLEPHKNRPVPQNCRYSAGEIWYRSTRRPDTNPAILLSVGTGTGAYLYDKSNKHAKQHILQIWLFPPLVSLPVLPFSCIQMCNRA
jgi:hypothetical protein